MRKRLPPSWDTNPLVGCRSLWPSLTQAHRVAPHLILSVMQMRHVIDLLLWHLTPCLVLPDSATQHCTPD
jgi:hypothetical protein